MNLSISFNNRTGSINHNNRVFLTDNVDPERVKNNVVLLQENIEDAYNKLFSKAVEEYNQRQKRKDRKISNYYQKIKNSKQEKLFREIIAQVGNKDTAPVGSDMGDMAERVLEDYFKSFQANNPNFVVFNAVIHNDEATPHLHIDYIPVATGYKTGLNVRNSQTKALENMGFEAEGEKPWTAWRNREIKTIESVLKSYDLERKNMENKERNLSVAEYKLQKRNEELQKADLEIKNKEIKLDNYLGETTRYFERLEDKKESSVRLTADRYFLKESLTVKKTFFEKIDDLFKLFDKILVFVKEKAEKIISNANFEVQKIKNEAEAYLKRSKLALKDAATEKDEIINQAKAEAEEIKFNAKNDMKNIEDEARANLDRSKSALNDVSTKKEEIISQANKDAEKIKSDARHSATSIVLEAENKELEIIHHARLEAKEITGTIPALRYLFINPRTEQIEIGTIPYNEFGGYKQVEETIYHKYPYLRCERHDGNIELFALAENEKKIISLTNDEPNWLGEYVGEKEFGFRQRSNYDDYEMDL